MNSAAKSKKITLGISTAAALVALTLPAAAIAQLTGTSHPDETVITSSPERIQPSHPAPPPPPPQQISGYVATPDSPATPVLKTRGASSYNADPTTSALTDVRRGEPMLRDAGPSADDGIVTRLPGAANDLPLGTLLHVKISHEISTRTTVAGTAFTASLDEPVERDGRVLLPVGTVLSGVVSDVHGGTRFTGSPSIHLLTRSLTLPDGTSYSVQAQVIDTALFKQTKVDSEGTILGRDHVGQTAAAMSLTTGAGAASGAVIAGIPGAVIGAGVGAGISTVVWLRQDRQTELPAATRVVFQLMRPLTVSAIVAASPIATQ
jgi:hypothetical protein